MSSRSETLPAARPTALLAWVRSGVTHNALLARVTLAYAASWVMVAGIFGLPATIQPRLVAEYIAAFGILFVCFSGIAASVLRLRARRSGRVAEVLLPYKNADRIAAACGAILLCACLATVFTTYKAAIPRLQPFTWDAELMRLDRLLHGGDPWRLFRSLLGHPLITTLLAVVYGPVWFFTGAAMLGWMAWSPDADLRRRFFLAYAVLWIGLGTAGAIALSSAGPPYLSLVYGGDNPYAELFADLQQRAPWVVQTQLTLWEHQLSGVTLPGSGISAAPSLHVAQLAVFTFFCSSVSRRLAWLLGGLTVVTLIATIQLGWHYAVDGYLAVGAAYLVSRVIGRR